MQIKQNAYKIIKDQRKPEEVSSEWEKQQTSANLFHVHALSDLMVPYKCYLIRLIYIIAR